MQSRSPLPKSLHFAELSPQRQALVRLCQKTNFGSIRGLEIKEGQPVFEPAPTLLIDLKLDRDDPPRPEVELPNFSLTQEIIRLMRRLDERGTATIELLEVHAGIPGRVIFRAAPGDEVLLSPSLMGPKIDDYAR